MQVRMILQQCRPSRQTLMFSATFKVREAPLWHLCVCLTLRAARVVHTAASGGAGAGSHDIARADHRRHGRAGVCVRARR